MFQHTLIYIFLLPHLLLGHLDNVFFLRLRMKEFRRDPQYILYYVNISHLLITGIFPVASLIFLNYMVYKQLVERRKQAEVLGKCAAF